jgi:nucleoside 2-deoxyribosyltransferase
MNQWDVFLAAGLRQTGCLRRNQEVLDIATYCGLTMYSPGHRKNGLEVTPIESVTINRDAITRSKAVLFIPDNAGAGVFYELGTADALGKLVIGYTESISNINFGKVIMGRWLMIPKEFKAYSIEQLYSLFKHLRDELDGI